MQSKQNEKKEKPHKFENIWIVKPGENSNRGNGISVCSKLKEIKNIVQESEYNKANTFII